MADTVPEEEIVRMLDEALSRSEIAWWEWDIKNNKVICNELKTTMLGYAPEEFRDVGYQAFTDLLHPDDHERAMQAMRDHLEGRAPIYQIDYRIRRADGTYTWYMDRGGTIEKAGDGSPARLRGVVIDLGAAISDQATDGDAVALIRRSLPSIAGDRETVALCSSCKDIRLEDGTWMPIDSSFEWAFMPKVSHSICPSCVRILYPDMAEEILATPGR